MAHNIELAEKVLGHVRLNPVLHDQSSGSLCMLGWTNQLSNGGEDYRLSAPERAAHALGMNPWVALFIWATPIDFLGRWYFAAWLAYAKALRRLRERASARASVREERRTLKRMAKDEERYQKLLDKQAREAVLAVYAKVDEAQAQRRREAVNA